MKKLCCFDDKRWKFHCNRKTRRGVEIEVRRPVPIYEQCSPLRKRLRSSAAFFSQALRLCGVWTTYIRSCARGHRRDKKRQTRAISKSFKSPLKPLRQRQNQMSINVTLWINALKANQIKKKTYKKKDKHKHKPTLIMFTLDIPIRLP